MAALALTETTVRYLFATSWLPCNPEESLVRVPGGVVTGMDAGGNLLHIAMWSLRRQGLMEFEQLTAVEDEPITVLGGQSFSRFKLLDEGARLPGLEGAVLRAAAAVEPMEGWLQKGVQRLSNEDEHGVRRLVSALELNNRAPWGTVCSYCFTEALAAGLVEAKGRLSRKIVISDPAAVESLRERNDELRAARGAYLKAEPDLTNAVVSDCLKAVWTSYQPNFGD